MSGRILHRWRYARQSDCATRLLGPSISPQLRAEKCGEMRKNRVFLRALPHCSAAGRGRNLNPQTPANKGRRPLAQRWQGIFPHVPQLPPAQATPRGNPTGRFHEDRARATPKTDRNRRKPRRTRPDSRFSNGSSRGVQWPSNGFPTACPTVGGGFAGQPTRANAAQLCRPLSNHPEQKAPIE